MDTLGITSELEAVNLMLDSIGEQPVNSIAETLTESNIAYSHLVATSREVQSWGWIFNREYGYPLALDLQGTVQVPTNLLDADFGSTRYIIRGNKVYDRQNHTYTHSGDLSCNIVFFLDWLEIPEVARQFIINRAARRFQQGMVSSQVLRAFTKEDESQAYARLRQYDARNGNYNLKHNAEYAGMINRTPTEFNLF